jgi:hypothetical protein
MGQTYLSGANLAGAGLVRSNLRRANLSGADLTGAYLTDAILRDANLSGANLTGAHLNATVLVEVDLQGAVLNNSMIYGASVWNVKGEIAEQKDLVITRHGEHAITVDDIEVAQFVYLLLRYEKVRNVIDTIGQKGVLILGRFTEERKAVLDAIRNKLRELGFVPMMFDFERPTQRDFTETIRTLAGMSRFIIADITNPKSSPLELQALMPDYMIPFVPIIQENEEPFAMFRDLRQKYGEWVLDVLEYDSAGNLLTVLDDAVVRPALQRSDELLPKKAEAVRKRHVRDFQ